MTEKEIKEIEDILQRREILTQKQARTYLYDLISEVRVLRDDARWARRMARLSLYGYRS